MTILSIQSIFVAKLGGSSEQIVTLVMGENMTEEVYTTNITLTQIKKIFKDLDLGSATTSRRKIYERNADRKLPG